MNNMHAWQFTQKVNTVESLSSSILSSQKYPRIATKNSIARVRSFSSDFPNKRDKSYRRNFSSVKNGKASICLWTILSFASSKSSFHFCRYPCVIYMGNYGKIIHEQMISPPPAILMNIAKLCRYTCTLMISFKCTSLKGFLPNSFLPLSQWSLKSRFFIMGWQFASTGGLFRDTILLGERSVPDASFEMLATSADGCPPCFNLLNFDANLHVYQLWCKFQVWER